MAKTFTIVRKGYHPEEVDHYIDQLESELSSYKKKEQAITDAIIKAQLTANQIILEAENNTKQMHKDAIEQLHYIKDMIDGTKEQLHTFQEEYNKMVSRYLIDFNQKDLDHIDNELDKLYDSLIVKEASDEEDKKYERTQAQNLATQKHEDIQQDNGITKEEMDSLFGK